MINNRKQSFKIEKLSTLIQKNLSNILQKHFTNLGMCSITSIKLSKDLSYADIYLSFFNNEFEQTTYKLQKIKQNASKIRYLLSQNLRKIRHTPELRFFLDNSLEELDKINNLLQLTK